MMAETHPNPDAFRRGGRRNGENASDTQRAVVDSIRDVTGASVEDIEYELRECDGDVNKATEKLIDTPFTVVQPRKPKATKVQNRGGRKGTGREGPSNKSRPIEGRIGRGGGESNQRVRRDKPRTAGRAKPMKENKGEQNGIEEIEKTKPTTPPPAPKRKHYLEALCGKGKTPTEKDDANSGFLVAKPDLASFSTSGWEAASAPVNLSAPQNQAPLPSEQGIVEEEQPEVADVVAEVDPTEETKEPIDEEVEQTIVKKESADDTQQTDTPIAADPPKADVFPFPMADIRFTREDTIPLVAPQLPDTLKMTESCIGSMLNVGAEPLDMSTIEFLFGTFEGITNRAPSIPVVVEREVQETVESTPVLIEDVPVATTASSFVEESETAETLESTSLQPQIDSETESSRLASLPKSTVDLLSAATDTSQQLSVDAFAASKPLEFRLDVQEVQVTQPMEQTAFMTTESSVKEEALSTHLITSTSMRTESQFVGSMPNSQDKAQTRPSLEETPDFAKSYQEGFTVAVETQKTEELPTTLDTAEPRPQQPHRQPGNITETTPVIEAEPTFSMSSGPTPSVPSYTPQRHQPTHKIPEKTGPPPQVGPGVTTHTHASKYTSRQSGGVPPPGTNQNVPVHGAASLNTTNSGNQSLPMIPQVPPFIGPGMVPNPAMPFPTGGYYPHLMQYQHQMYHGMYPPGTYSGFGPPFNHDSVGHPPHANPVGVPPNQGNTVYDNSNPSSFSNNKEKDNVFLSQQQLPHAGFPGGPQPVPRNDASLFYNVHGQPFSQNMRTQFPGGGFAGHIPGAGFVAPPHTFHPPGQQGNNFRLH